MPRALFGFIILPLLLSMCKKSEIMEPSATGNMQIPAEIVEIIEEMISILEPEGKIRDYKTRMKYVENMPDEISDKLSLIGDRWEKLPSWKRYANEWDWQHPVTNRKN